jgi:hypothetical protein
LTINVQKLYYILFLFVTFSTVGQTQTLTNTYVDRCTGETEIVSINFVNGSATVAFYNKVRTFTWAEYTNGTLKNWLDETYVWWSTLSPCSTTTAATQTTQQTTNNATSNATNAASNATSNATNTTGTTSTSNTSNTNSSSSSTSSNGSSADSQSGNNSNESSNSSGEGSSGSGEGSSEGSGSEGEGSNSENQENQESEEKTEEVKEESKEEEKKEESKEEKEEEKEEESKEEEKEEKKEEKKKRNPIAVAANLMTQQALDGTFSRAASFGFSQSSLTGTTTYAINAMVWDNLEQFSIGASQTDVYFNYDREEKLYLWNPETKKEDLYFGSIYHRGSIMLIQSISVNFMYIYGTKIGSFGMSNVYLGQKDNFWKGFVGGWALNGTIIGVKDNITIMPSGVLFGTKPFPTKRVTISPMLALAFNPVSYTFNLKGRVFREKLIWNEHVTYIIGSNFDVGITQRFRFNIGGNIVGSTLPGIPITWSATIGSKFQF